MSMTKKDFELVAKVILKAYERVPIEDKERADLFIKELSDALAQEYPNFNPDMFIQQSTPTWAQ